MKVETVLMKKSLFLLCFILAFPLIAQESPKSNPPVIVAKIPFGESVIFEDVTITFSKILEDSRCPSDVTCVWAGQAKVLAKIQTQEGTIEKELIFHGTSFGTESENTLFVSKAKTYMGYRLSPYPVSTVHRDKRIYFLEIYLK